MSSKDGRSAPDEVLGSHDATVTDTRSAIAAATDVEAILQDAPPTIARESEDGALESEALRRVNLRIGDQLMSAGWRLNDAVVAFVAAGATEKLVALGDLCAERAQVEVAVDAYTAAGATEKLVTFGDRCVEEKWLPSAVDAYIAAGEAVPVAKLIETGDRCVEKATDDKYVPPNRKELFESAQKAYAAAGATEKLVRLGDICAKKGGEFSIALASYVAVGATEKLVALGDRCATEHWFWGAVNAYVAAGAAVPVEKLIMCGDRCLEGGWLDTAEKAYEAAGAVMTVDKLMVCGDRCFKEGRLDDAREAYMAAERIQLKREGASDAT